MTLLALLLSCGGDSAPAEGDFSVYYSHNVAGEIEPCG